MSPARSPDAHPDMRRVPPARCSWALGLVLLVSLAGSTAAREQPLQLSVLVADSALGVEQVLAGAAGPFEPVEDGRVQLGVRAGHTHWIRIESDLQPPSGEGEEGRQVLWIERVPVARLRLHQPQHDVEAKQRSFFRPPQSEPFLFGAYAFALAPGAAGPRVLLLELQAAVPAGISPRLVAENDYLAVDRDRAMVFSAMYVGLVVLALLALSTALAMRDRAWLALAAFVVNVLLVLLALNGHAYAVPGLRVLAGAGVAGIFGLSLLLVVSMIVIGGQFSAIGRLAPHVQRRVHWLLGVLAGLALACFFVPAAWTAALQPLMVAVWATGLLVCLGFAILAWRGGIGLGRPLTLVWLLLAGAIAARVLAGQGVLAPSLLSLYGFQFMLAATALLFALAQADRMIEFRHQRERARLAKSQVDAHLRVEQVRRRFVEELHTGMRGADTNEVEWLAFRRLLEAMRSLLPQQGSAVLAFGYHGLDLLLAEPLGLKEEYSRLLAHRGSTLKSLCRNRKPVPLLLEEVVLDDGEVVPGGLFAVVPLQIARPGWGVLLVHREAASEFDPEELRLLSEFSQMAVNAADEAAAAVDLRRRAELDPLTGALNRRAMDMRLAAGLQRAHSERRPLALLFVDLDHFKQVNDQHGHAVGDDCLRLLSDCIRRNLGPEDLFGRFGGEEFIVALPDRTPEQARALAEQLREAVAGLQVVGETTVTFTVSIGLASRLPSERDPQPILERADKALYQAKRSGRNRVQVASLHSLEGPYGMPAPR